MARSKRSAAERRRRVHELLEESPTGDRASRLVDRLLITLIVVNLAAVTLESVPDLQARYRTLFVVVEIVSLAIFTAEYLLRLYTAVEHAPWKDLPPRRARWRYAMSFAGLVDLFAVLPFWLAFLVPGELRALQALRIFRFLKLARYSPGVRSLLDALYKERRALGGCMLILAACTMIAAAFIHVFEREAQPDKFGTIPDAMWWAVVTLGTIGYGDVVPVTVAGKIVAAATIIAAVVVVALPVGIVATAFAALVHRRDFVVTWSMVARVPLFAGLTAGEIADVMQLLRAKTVEAGDVITRRGDPAHSMYFIARGEVEFDLGGKLTRLGDGHFFGEIAALRRSRRSATVRATRRTSLLVLDAGDLQALMQRQPEIARRLREAVHTRLGRELITADGDIVIEEIATKHTAPRARKRRRQS